jgi:hypothetical protein
MSRWPSQPSPSPRQHQVLVFLRAEALAFRAPTLKQIAEHVGSGNPERAHWFVSCLERDGFIARAGKSRKAGRAVQLTPKGIAAADAPCPTGTLTKGTQQRRKRSAAKAAERPRPPVPRDETAVPVAAPVPALPSALASFRGIQHPALPMAFSRPRGVGAERWESLTTLRSARSDAA